MKKGWREKRRTVPEQAQEVRVHASLVEREGKHYGLVDLSFILETGLPKEALDDVVNALRNAPATVIADDPISKLPVAWFGPWNDPQGAEMASRGAVQLICNVLGIRQGAGPQIRTSPGTNSTTADFNTSNATNPRQLGGPPEDLAQRIARGKEIAAGSDDAMTLVIAAWQRLRRDDPEAHILRLVLLARGVVSWLSPHDGSQTPLLELEARARGLAHMISNNLPNRDEFVLLLSNRGQDGFYTHIGSLARDTIIALLGEYLNALRADQQGKN